MLTLNQILYDEHYIEQLTVRIPGNTPSKKSGQIAVCPRYCRGKNTDDFKKKKLLPNPLYTKWVKKAKKEIGSIVYTGGYPAKVNMFFVRETKRKFDFDGLGHSVLDFLVETGIIEDDSMMHVIPVFSGWRIDKGNPCCIVNICPRVVAPHSHKYGEKNYEHTL